MLALESYGLSLSFQGLNFVMWWVMAQVKGMGIDCVLEDLNEWIGDEVRVGITIAFEVSGENDNGRRVVEEFCTERGCFWVT